MNWGKTEHLTPYTTLIPVTKCPAGSKGNMQPCSQSLPTHTRQMCCRKSYCTYVARKVQLPKGSKSNIIGLLLIQPPQTPCRHAAGVRGKVQLPGKLDQITPTSRQLLGTEQTRFPGTCNAAVGQKLFSISELTKEPHSPARWSSNCW